MTELEIPPDATEDRATALVTEHVAVGDVVEVWEADRTDASDPDRTGEVTGLERGISNSMGSHSARAVSGTPRFTLSSN